MQSNTISHTYETRNKNVFQIAKHNTTMYEKGLCYAGQIFHNKLPVSLQEEQSLNVFKKNVRIYLLEKYIIYKISDFYK